MIDGLPAPTEGGGTDPARMDLAARVIEAVKPRPDIATRLSQVDVSDAHNAAVILSGDPAVIQLGERGFLKHLQGYLELAPTLRDRIPDIDSVDLRFDSRVYRTAGGCGPAGAADGERSSESEAQAVAGWPVRPAEAEDEWREKNDIWSGSTSARRR